MKFGPRTGVDPLDVTERAAKAKASVREADLLFDMRMTRMARNWNRCRCGHSKTVHVDKVCQMECECAAYRKR
jgi:hypothetical protein